MPSEEKPYRIYKGGRAKGKLPTLPRPERRPKLDGASPRTRERKRAPRRRRYARWFAILLGLFLAWLTAWSLASYFSFRDGVKAANARLPQSVRKQLAGQGGLLLTHSTTILLLGTDHADLRSRSGLRHSDSIMLVRTDPSHHRIYYLSIPRDLYVPIPGHGEERINSAMQIGGPTLAIATIRQLTGLDVNHVAIVDFGQFEDLINRVGGIDVYVPERILSNRFDCPYTAARCASWKGWRFAKGKQHMNGHRALIYSRIRENQLNPADNDITRAERQQAVIQALLSKLSSFGTFFDLPFAGGDLLKPLTTDLTPGELIQLGWVKFRSGSDRAVHCRLGGNPDTIGGASVIRPSEEDRNVIAMVRGESAPQPPPPGSGTYGPGCVTGNHTLGAR
jgi:polyisoprenyl-teichoic acid--peptidoglycan teichoic acid transferase